MKVVAITSCATGIVCMYMAAETIKKGYKKKEYACEVEMQEALRIENKFLGRDTKTVDLIVFANSMGISKTERFDAYKDKIVRHTPYQVIQKPNIIFEALR